jgi:hypothetical protein
LDHSGQVFDLIDTFVDPDDLFLERPQWSTLASAWRGW